MIKYQLVAFGSVVGSQKEGRPHENSKVREDVREIKLELDFPSSRRT